MTKVRVRRRLDRIELGNFGDTESVGEGVYELRLHFGSGYRVYFGRVGSTVIVGSDQGMTQIAASTELGRESLYKALSESGNPQFSTVQKIVSALGLQISIEPVMNT